MLHCCFVQSFGSSICIQPQFPLGLSCFLVVTPHSSCSCFTTSPLVFHSLSLQVSIDCKVMLMIVDCC
ncbi:hypothetical protein SOVF_210140 [Spinacia oleracea]|nr:hypothetical protein SOVF_210140 [Spinacia oleracea]